jgi:hypothetical protein
MLQNAFQIQGLEYLRVALPQAIPEIRIAFMSRVRYTRILQKVRCERMPPGHES